MCRWSSHACECSAKSDFHKSSNRVRFSTFEYIFGSRSYIYSGKQGKACMFNIVHATRWLLIAPTT